MMSLQSGEELQNLVEKEAIFFVVLVIRKGCTDYTRIQRTCFYPRVRQSPINSPPIRIHVAMCKESRLKDSLSLS